MEQVIGRARRICSHQNLPIELRNVTVFLYLMTFSQEQLKTPEFKHIRIEDNNQTTDEALYNIATIKESISQKILMAVKESSIDCTLHSKFGAKDQLQCFSFGSPDSNKFSYMPSITQEEMDNTAKINIKQVTWSGQEIFYKNEKYVVNPKDKKVYNYDSYLRGQPEQIGTIIGNDIIDLQGKKL
jgi:hypothetical protein